MNKLSLLFSILFSITMLVSVEAQTFTFQPGETVTEYVELEHYKNIQVDMVHPGFDDITFGWVTVENNMLDKWDYTSCDNGGCYSLLPDSAMIGPLSDTVPGFIKITVNPRDQAGTSTVLIYVYNTKYPDDGQFVTFEIIASGLTLVEDPSEETLHIYPNPATDFITIENISETFSNFEIIDMSGKNVLTGTISAKQNKTFDLHNYPEGIYFVRYQHEDAYLTRKVIIQ